MLIVALVLAVIGLAALVAAVVTSNEILAWVCIAASSLGVVLLVVDAIRERRTKQSAGRDLALAAAGGATIVLADAETAHIDTATEVDAVEVDAVEGDAVEGDAVEGDAVENDGLAADIADEEFPEEVVHEEPEFDTWSDDEPEYPESAEAATIHVVTEDDLAAEEDLPTGADLSADLAEDRENSAGTAGDAELDDRDGR